MVFDLTRPQTLEAVATWVRAVRDAVGNDTVLILLGNKADLDKNRKVTKEQAEAVATQLQLYGYFETSAKTGQHVTQCFNTLATEMHKQAMERARHP